MLVGADRLAVDVAQRDLALGVGQQALDRLVVDVPQLADAVQDGVRVVDRRRHQRVGLAAGVAEHHALVAGALVLVAGGVHALGDVGRLRVQVAGDVRLVPAEAGLVVADVVDRHAGEMRAAGPGVTVAGPRVSPANTTRLVVTSVSQATRE